MTPRKLTRKAFTAWLEGQPEGARFERTSPWRCPVAKFLGQNAEVGRLTYGDGSSVVRLTPKWANCFIRKFDAGQSGSKSAALAALKSVP